ncbi:GNAT family N-acetyltransferase [Clostridium felsineum]|uniref:GNAT family N-acetyltransferase n=1 Tax=Clostridium felsineum TaxID=36839 RepID=UPI00214DA270|nr:GNAT family N-acetyltransferase [Clostridium felsineum]MCR3759397.1 GNAT family N-acetyltransferase [Clostridium felsineum]
MEVKLTIREFIPTDAKEIANLYNKCSFYHAEYGYQISENDINISYKERGTHIMVVALYDDHIVGILGAFPVSGYKVAEKDSAFIGSLLIHPEFRGSGTLIRSLYAYMIRKVVEKGFNCIRTEIFPSNSLSLRLAKKTGYVLTKDCKTDMDYYIDLISYLPAALKCFKVVSETEDDKTVDVYNLGFSLIHTKEQYQALAVTSEIKQGNREVVPYKISIDKKQFTIVVDVLSKKVCSLEGLGFKISCDLDTGKDYFKNDMALITWRIENYSQSPFEIQIVSNISKFKRPIYLVKTTVSENNEKKYIKSIKCKKIGIFSIDTNIKLTLNDKDSYYIRLGVGFEVKKQALIELKDAELESNNIKVQYLIMNNSEDKSLVKILNSKFGIFQKKDELYLEDTLLKEVIHNDAEKQVAYFKGSSDKKRKRFDIGKSEVWRRKEFSAVKLGSKVIVISKNLKFFISLIDGRIEVYTSKGKLIVTELWPLLGYPHISGIKIDKKRNVKFLIIDDSIVLEEKIQSLKFTRRLNVSENEIEVLADFVNTSFKKREGGIGKIQPWLEWNEAEIYVPSNGRVFHENFIYNLFPLGISDMIVGNIREFDVDRGQKGEGWTAFSNGEDTLEFEWDFSQELRFGQRFMPSIMFEVPCLSPRQSFKIPTYRYKLNSNDFKAKLRDKAVVEYVFLKSGEAYITNSTKREMHVSLELNTFSNHDLNASIKLLLKDSENKEMFEMNSNFESFKKDCPIKVDQILALEGKSDFQILNILIVYEDKIRKKEFNIPVIDYGTGQRKVREILKQEKAYEKYLVNNTNIELDFVPLYGGTITGLKYNCESKIVSSYPKCIAYEAEANWYGGISSYIIKDEKDKLSSMLKPLCRLESMRYEREEFECEGIFYSGFGMQGSFLNETIKSAISYLMIEDSSILLMNVQYMNSSVENIIYTGVFSIYPKMTMISDNYNFYVKQYTGREELLKGYKKLNAVLTSTGHSYIIIEEIDKKCFTVIATFVPKEQSIYLNQLKQGINICLTQKILLKNHGEKQMKAAIGYFDTFEKAVSFGENAQLIISKCNKK